MPACKPPLTLVVTVMVLLPTRVAVPALRFVNGIAIRDSRLLDDGPRLRLPQLCLIRGCYLRDEDRDYPVCHCNMPITVALRSDVNYSQVGNCYRYAPGTCLV